MSVQVENTRSTRQDHADVDLNIEPTPQLRHVAGPVTFTIAIGLLLTAYAGYMARKTGGTVDLLIWSGNFFLFAGPAWAALAKNVHRSSRIAAVVIGGTAAVVSRVLLYPTFFAYHDELLHLNSLRLIQERQHLFEVANSSLPVSKFYPGLEVATDGIQQITGLSSHVAGSILLILARLVLMLSLVRSVEWMTKSARIACLAGVLYICSPQFRFFNSQYSYQSIALPLCFYAVYLFGTSTRKSNWALVAPALAMAAAAMSHHLTTLGAVLVFVGWWLVARHRKTHQPLLGAMALLAVGIVAAWTAFAHDQVLVYIEEIAQSSIQSISNVVSGSQSSNKLFADNGGTKTPLWQRGVSVLSILFTVSAVALAFWRLRRNPKDRAGLTSAGVALFGVAAMYPLIPGSHLTVASAEVGDRSSSFIYVGVVFVVATWLAAVKLNAWRRVAVMGALVITYAGGLVLGGGPPWLQTPGPYLVAGDNRGVDAYGLSKAYWMQTYLTPNSRILSDRVNGLLDSTYGHQHVFRHLGDRLDMGTTSTLLLKGPQGDYDKELINYADLHYLVADRRLATGLPRFGVYIEQGEWGTIGTQERTEPPPLSAFTKFDRVSGADRIYDNGAISIYDVRALNDKREMKR